MKNFFKKIGKGLRNLGKGIKKAFNSKIGRVIGTIALAVAMPYIFNAFAGAGAGAGAGVSVTGSATAGTASTTLGASTATAAGSIAPPVAATAEAVAATVTPQAQALTVGGEITSFADAVNVGKTMQQSSANLINSSTSASDIVGVSSSPVKITEAALNNTSTIIDKESIMQNKFNTILKDSKLDLKPLQNRELELVNTYGDNAYNAQKFYELEQRGILGRRMSADKIARSQYEYLFQSEYGSSGSMQLVDGKMTGLAGDTNAYADVLSLKPSSLKASTQHPSVGAAWSAGEGPVEKIANVGKHFLDMDIAQATGYEGALSGSSVIGTGMQGASLLSQMQPQEEISFGSSNYGAQIQAGAQAEAAQEITMAPPLQTIGMQEELMTATNPAQLMSSIRSQAGYSQLYGSLYNFGTANV